MNRSPNAFSPFRQIRGTIKRQYRKGLAFFLICVSLITSVVLFWGNTFSSDARIFIRLGRESVAMDPTVASRNAITVNDTREVEINSILELFQSRDLAEQVVDKLGSETILAGLPPGNGEAAVKSSVFSTLISQIRVYKDGRAISLKERAITRLLRDLKVWAPKKTTVVGIEYGTDSPEVAQLVVNAVIEAFKTEHARVNRTEGSYDFLREQCQLLERKLVESQHSVRDAKNEIGLVSVDGHKQLLQNELEVIETRLINVNSEFSGSRARLTSLEQATAGLPERELTEDVVVANDATSRMRELLYEVQLREQDFASKYTSAHPFMKAVREQSKQAQEIYDSQDIERAQKTTGFNAARQQLEVLVFTERANFESLSSTMKSLSEQRDTIAKRLIALNEDEVKLAELQRVVDLAEENFRNYSERTELARLDQQLENQRISNVSIIQPASFVEKPASPNRILLLALGLVFAFCGAVGVMIMADSVFLGQTADLDKSESIFPWTTSSQRPTASAWRDDALLPS